MSDHDFGGRITVRGLAEGAMMTALSLILAVISTYVPILSLVAPLLFPVPMAFVVLRHGLKLGLISAVSTFLLSAMLLSLPNALYLFIQFGFLGLFFGWCFRQQKNAMLTLLCGVLISSMAVMVNFLFPTLVSGISIDQYQEMASAMINEYVSLLQQPGLSSEALMGGMTPAAYAAYMEALLKRLLPSVLLCSAMGLTLLCYVLMCKLLRRFGYEMSKLPPFSMWRLDWRLLWVLIVALALSGLGGRFGYDMVARVGDNMLMVMSPILVVCGASLAAWLLKRWRVAKFIKILAILFVLQVFSGAINLLIIIGVFDPIFDFRRRIERLLEKRKMG